MAVASSASAIPGATTASEVFFEAAIDWKLCIIPQTVPNKPINNAFEPTAAKKPQFCSSFSSSRLRTNYITCNIRSLWPILWDSVFICCPCLHSFMALTNTAARGLVIDLLTFSYS